MISKGTIKFDPSDDDPDPDWNKRLLDSKFGTIFQTEEYGNYEKFIGKCQPKYFKFRNEDNIVVGQILLFKVFRGKGSITKLITRRLGTKYAKWIWSHGPVVFDEFYYDEILNQLFNFFGSTSFEGSPHPQDNKQSLGKQKAATFIIDLNQNVDDIFKKTDKKSVQKNIERSRERGVTVKEFSIADRDYVGYSSLLNKYRQSNGFDTYSDDQIKEVFHLATSTTGKGTGFLAWYEKTLIGGIFISAFNGYINEWGIARSPDDTKKKLYAQDLLRWTIIEWGKKKGCKFYDLSGVKYPEEQQSPKEKGIFQNKKKWGGELILYPIFKKQELL